MVYNYILKNLEINNLKTIIEVGGRYGTESVDLAKDFSTCTIHTFECNPRTSKQCAETCATMPNIIFNNIGVSKNGDKLPFYSYVADNDGCSSFYQRIDGQQTMEYAGDIETITLKQYLSEKNIDSVDCLCLDTQGSELDIIEGCGELVKNIQYIILEQPNEIPNDHYMPLCPSGKGLAHSKYINAPTAQTIKDYLFKNGFCEIYRQKENEIEFNVVYKNMLYKKKNNVLVL
jgi:FkbM family methyltransferase